MRNGVSKRLQCEDNLYQHSTQCRTKALQTVNNEVLAALPVSSHLDITGCRLRTYASTLRANLISDVEARLLIPLAAEACPKPLRIYVPPANAAVGPSSPAPTTGSFFPRASSFRLRASTRGSSFFAAEEPALALASCVLTDSGELLVIDHSDDGLAALRPRSLGFLAPGATLPPAPEPSHHGQALRRYPIVLAVHRPAIHRRGGLTAGHRSMADLAFSQASAAEDLLLFAPSRNQYNVLRSAVDGLSAVTRSTNPPGLETSSKAGRDGKLIEARGGQGESQSEGAKGLETIGNTHAPLFAGHGDSQPSETWATPLLSEPFKPIASPQVRPTAGAADQGAVATVARDVASWRPLAATVCNNRASSAHLAEGHSTNNHVHKDSISGSGSATVESAAPDVREQISAVRDSLLHILSHASRSPRITTVQPKRNFLTTTYSAVGADLHSVLAAAASELCLSAVNTNPVGDDEFSGEVWGSDKSSVFDDVESGRRLQAHLDLREAAAGLVAGLDVAMVREIHRYAEENARLRARLRKPDAEISSCKTGAVAGETEASEESIIISGGPTSTSVAIVCVHALT